MIQFIKMFDKIVTKILSVKLSKLKSLLKRQLNVPNIL